MTMNHSRLSCIVPTFGQDLPSVIDCFEKAFEFFGGCPRRIVIDNFRRKRFGFPTFTTAPATIPVPHHFG
jgi:hypothetical protein